MKLDDEMEKYGILEVGLEHPKQEQGWFDRVHTPIITQFYSRDGEPTREKALKEIIRLAKKNPVDSNKRNYPMKLLVGWKGSGVKKVENISPYHGVFID